MDTMEQQETKTILSLFEQMEELRNERDAWKQQAELDRKQMELWRAEAERWRNCHS